MSDPFIDEYDLDDLPISGTARRISGLNPKTLVGVCKVPALSVVPPAAIIYLGLAMRYGAHEAPKKDGTFGYGKYNWRDQPVEASTYIDAAFRHLMQYWDGEDIDPSSKAPHLAHALATLAVLVDAIESGTCADDRPKVRSGVASKILDRETRKE